MISIEDCIALCGLSEDEVLAIAEHENIPEIAAAALGHYLMLHADGPRHVMTMIVDDIRSAQARGDSDRVQALLHVLHHFIRRNPQAAPQVHPWSRVLGTTRR
jgi:hypothetical protein